ncbi:acyl-CoA dehydrogenase family protein [Pontibacillus marinus]|uniref:Isovaleryl-CoA dehydrogenase n=1 Tax=Pontibacillus marinus BH030004 = DSM 16465 TaxID=1385511 RepID=A0A0A5HKQ0_9BACI|nr:acyl-CoA dehydrogenase family protein [Pontibacillus marinus]KGX84222.1 isovaleryl-CoA dehydrogenase [Pontibacillus marinus BH030004 = DSM 16465]
MNFFKEDPNLSFILKQYLDDDFYKWAEKELDEYGEVCANEVDERAVHTDREGQPKLIKYDKMGNDISHVWLNEGYKETVKDTYGRGIVGYVHKEIPELGRKGNYMYSYAQGYLLSQSEPGFYCPVTLTMATAYLLDHYGSKELKDKYLPHVLSTGDVELYEGATFLTERQGGSDVGANETTAISHGDHYRLYGEKYFASNAGACGVATVLARREDAPEGTKGLSLFLVPWRNKDDSLNGIQIRRLKDKLGVRAVPSAEVVFDGAEAYMIGEPEQGIYYMMEALNLSRVCNAIASIGIMQRGYLEARNYAYERKAFGNTLKDYPMVRDTLVRLRAKQEVETSAVFSLISLFDRVMTDREASSVREIALNRLLIALLKKETAEQAIHFSHESIEMHGGNGFIEDFVTPRLLRDAQVLTVWEGTANILGLEVLRLMHKYQVHNMFIEEMQQELDALPVELADETAFVKGKVRELQELINRVVVMDEGSQTYYSKTLADRMTAIYESVISLKDAAVGGERKKAIAEVFLQLTWKRDELDFDQLSLKHFDRIVEQKEQVNV